MPEKNNHSSAIVKITEPADGLLAVTVRCCNDSKTDSVLTLHNLERTGEELDAAIAVHQQKVESRHAAKHAALGHFARWNVLLDQGCGCK